MRTALLALVLASASFGQESLAERIVALRAKVEAGTASPNERYDLAAALRRAGREDLALDLALALTREPGFEPWAHYLVGQLRFHLDARAAREAFARARDGARALGDPGASLARQASEAVADSEKEERRGALHTAAESRIHTGLWIVALAWLAAISGGLYFTRRSRGSFAHR